MKTTLDIADNLFQRAKSLSHREKVTMRELVEEGLDLVLSKHAVSASFQVVPVTFKGNGLTPEFQNASWDTIRGAAYSGHGS